MSDFNLSQFAQARDLGGQQPQGPTLEEQRRILSVNVVMNLMPALTTPVNVEQAQVTADCFVTIVSAIEEYIRRG